jgi:ribosome-binding factor A
MNGRKERMEKILRNEVALIITTEIDDPRMHDLEITAVDMSGDLKNAKVYYAVSADGKEKEAIAKALISHTRFIRGEVASRIEMKFIPEISFREDPLARYERSTEGLFKQIEEERAAEEKKHGDKVTDEL